MTGRPLSHGRLAIRASARPRVLGEGPPEVAGSWTARILTLFPEAWPGVLGYSLTGRALNEGLWSLGVTAIREFARDRHRSVDDTPAGGGAGMVLRPDVLAAAVDAVHVAGTPLIALSPRGRPLTQSMVRNLSLAPGVTLICGRFEGIDQRLIDARGVSEISIGDFILSGGDIAAQALIDASVRLIPRVLGNSESVAAESFSNGLLEYPHYTRPNDWEGRVVPEVLLSGHHANIARWRQARSEELTKERRPDLWRAWLDAKATDPVAGAKHSDAKTAAAKGGKKDERDELA